MFVKNKPPKNYSFAAVDEANFILGYFFCQHYFFELKFCPSYVDKNFTHFYERFLMINFPSKLSNVGAYSELHF